MELTEKTAWGHLEHALGNARDAARNAVTDVRGPPAFIVAITSARDACRGLGLLRNDAIWISYANGMQQMLDLARGGMVSTRMIPAGDMRWLKIATNLDAVARKVGTLFLQSMAKRREEGSIVEVPQFGTNLKGN